jgi:hypothetical protein
LRYRRRSEAGIWIVKGLGVGPFAYLRDVRDRVRTHPHSRIEGLLPDRWKPAEAPDPPGRKG